MKTSSSNAHHRNRFARTLRRLAKEGYVYLYHLERPLGRPQPPEKRAEHGLPPREGDYRPHAGHYCGFTEDLVRRDQEHQRGGSKAAALLRAAKRRGITYQIVRVWVGDEELEKQLKRRKGAPRLCPICSKRPQPVRGAAELAPAQIQEALIPF